MMRKRPSTTRRTTSSRTSATRRPFTSRRWRGTARAPSTAARGSSWSSSAGGACRRRPAGCSEQPRDGTGLESCRESTLPRCTPVARRDRRYVAGVGADQWDRIRPLRGLDVRELVNHIVTGNYWAGSWAARPSRTSATVSTATCSATIRRRLRRLGAVASAAFRARGRWRSVRGVVRPGAGRGVLRAPLHRRAGPRLGRRQGRPARTRRSIPSSWRRASR